MDNSNKIYVVTTFSTGRKHIRPVGWFKHIKDAREVVRNNVYDIQEGLYTYAVIETLPVGLYPTANVNYQTEYYRYDSANDEYLPIDPSEVEDEHTPLYCWSIG